MGEIEPRSSEDLMIELVVGGLQGFSLIVAVNGIANKLIENEFFPCGCISV